MPVYNHYYPDSANQVNTLESARRLAFEGPTLPVAIGVPAPVLTYLQARNKPVPPPVVGQALIDTGASVCAIDEGIVQALGIPPFGAQAIHTPSGPAQQLTYPASLSFPGTPLPNISFADFVGAPLQAAGIVALIGRSVLRDYVFFYNGPGGSVTLTY